MIQEKMAEILAIWSSMPPQRCFNASSHGLRFKIQDTLVDMNRTGVFRDLAAHNLIGLFPFIPASSATGVLDSLISTYRGNPRGPAATCQVEGPHACISWRN